MHAQIKQGLVSVGIYRRVSTPGQASEGYSLDDQERVCRDYLDRAYGPGGYTARVFSDEGYSGKLGFAKPDSSPRKVRPGLSALVAAIAQDEISVVIFYRLDRLSRNARVWLEFLHEYVIKRSITLISVQDSIDGSTSIGRFAAGVLAMAAELFAEIGGETVRTALRRRRESGYHTGWLPYGWARDGKGSGNG